MGKVGADSAGAEVFSFPKTVGAVATSTGGVKLGAAGVLGIDSSSSVDSGLEATDGFWVAGPFPIMKCCDEIMD